MSQRLEIHPSWKTAAALFVGIGVGLAVGLYSPVQLLNRARTPVGIRQLYDHPEVHNYHFDATTAPVAVPGSFSTPEPIRVSP